MGEAGGEQKGNGRGVRGGEEVQIFEWKKSEMESCHVSVILAGT